MKIRKILLLTLVSPVLLATVVVSFKGMVMTGFFEPRKALSELTVSFGKIDSLPDPANIQTAGQWYLLNHLSSPLLEFDFKQNSYKPLLAESWSIEGESYIFHIKKGAKFSDGSPLTSRDLAASLKRMILLKSASHFPIWEYVKGCETLRTLSEPCDGIKILDEHTIRILLTHRRESFLLQMASPEGGIWHHQDIDGQNLTIAPTRFSGPYSLEKGTEIRKTILRQNPFSPLITEYPRAPSTIKITSLSRAEIEENLLQKRIDLFIGDYIPFNKNAWSTKDVGIHATTPSSILYLFRLTKNEGPKVPKELLEALWSQNADKNLIPADTFLPFGSLGAINKTDFLNALPAQAGETTLRIATPNVYFQEEFLDLLRESARKVHINLEFTRLPPADFFSLFDKPDSRFDFALSTYVASERYPAVQLRFLLNGQQTPFQFDLKDIDLIEENNLRLKKLFDFQRGLLKTQMVIPLFFIHTHLIYQNDLEIGDQPKTDAEVQLWKITNKSRIE